MSKLETARFGSAGKADSFSTMGYKKTEEIAYYLTHFGLTAFEYQCGRGVKVNEKAIQKLGELCSERDIALSLHAPYFISLSSLEEEKRANSIRYVVDSAKAAQLMGADRIVVHTGSCGKISREEALKLSGETLRRARRMLDEQGFSKIALCPETMGKVNQLGTLSEVITLCQWEERLIPCLDFGHLNARTFGGIKGKEEYRRILEELENGLGAERASQFHSHFSKIQYTNPGGEKMHLTFADRQYGPDFEPLMELIAQKGWTPRFICESAGTQAEDAQTMQKYYDNLKE